MNVRLENIHTELSPTNYVSFLQTRRGPDKGRSDRDSIHSVSSMRSIMSGMTAFWSSLGLRSASSKTEKAKAATEADLKYLYSAFTKLPSLRLTSDHRARLIKGYEEFPFDTAVPLLTFKNLQQLDIVDLDFRQFYGWDRLAEQLSLLTVKRAHIDDPAELLTDIVLDDAEKRRRRSTKNGRASPTPTSSWTVPSTPRADYAQSHSDPESPADGSPSKGEDDVLDRDKVAIAGSVSPKRSSPVRPASSYRHIRTYSSKARRSASGSSNSSDYSVKPHRSESASNLLSMNVLPASKWQRLKYLSLADNSLTSLSAKSLGPVASTLRSLNLSSNLFTEIPDSLASLTRLTSLDLSNCMIGSLQSLAKSPLPAITTIKLRSNRLQSLAGVERLLSLENLNVQDNRLTDPMEAARLTGLPNLRRIWVKHNPFVKLYPGYRITIFNLFRSTPGYIEDLTIDDYGPGYSERKQLTERVPEVEHRLSEPSVRTAEGPIIVQDIEPPRPALPEGSELTRAPSRRRKPPRRRIVDLAQDDSPQRMASEPAVVTRASIDSRRSVRKSSERTLSTPFAAVPVSSPLEPMTLDSHDIDGNSPEQRDDFRAKIEALRQEFGNNWLSALGEQGWHNDHHIEVQRGQTLGEPTSIHRTNSLNQAIVSAGRTLG
jgi:Leucine rich repeat